MKPSPRAIGLAPDQADFIDREVASGRYASEADVMAAALSALRERDETLERWLLDEVIPLFDAVQNGEATTVSAADSRAQLRAHHQERAADDA